jgi:peroxiredoxin
MSATPSTMLPLGTPLPDFSLPEPLTGEQRSPADFADPPLLLVTFICNHCPYVVHLKEALVAFAHDFDEKVQILAISSNSVKTHPQDGPDRMAEDAKAHRYPFPYLYDETQEVAKAFRAACTPEFYLFDSDRKLIYRGQFDDTRPTHRTAPDNEFKGKAPSGGDLRKAVEAALSGESIPADQQKPSLGCNIKWHPGNEPDYC